MKYSQWIGVVIALVVIMSCFLPWMEVPGTEKMVTGMNNMGTNLGKPGKLNIILSSIAIILFMIPKIWAKRTNLIFCALGIAWAFRNFLLYARCEMGVCPQRKYGLYLLFIGSALMLVAALLPDIKIPAPKKEPADKKPAGEAKDQETSA